MHQYTADFLRRHGDERTAKDLETIVGVDEIQKDETVRWYLRLVEETK